MSLVRFKHQGFSNIKAHKVLCTASVIRCKNIIDLVAGTGQVAAGIGQVAAGTAGQVVDTGVVPAGKGWQAVGTGVAGWPGASAAAAAGGS